MLKYNKSFKVFKWRYNVGTETYYRSFGVGLRYWLGLRNKNYIDCVVENFADYIKQETLSDRVIRIPDGKE